MKGSIDSPERLRLAFSTGLGLNVKILRIKIQGTHGFWLLWAVAALAAGMSAFYMFRVILLGKKGEENTLISDYAGIGFKYPPLAASITILLLSMAGIPPLGGFMANSKPKFQHHQ